MLKINKNKRRLFEKEITQNIDEAYQRFLTYIKSKWYTDTPYFISYPERDEIQLTDTLNYKNFLNNTFKYKKQSLKLFKFILKNKILSKEEINDINNYKLSNTNMYVCISRNPIDYMFCSTDQSYSSCISMTSSGIGP